MIWRCEAFEQLSVDRLYAVLRLRAEVFVLEQHCLYVDADGADPQCLHLSAWQGAALLAYARLVPPGLKAQQPCIGRVLTAASARGTGLGHKLMRRALQACHAQWPGLGITLFAQTHLRGFYEGHGFHAVGEVYNEDRIPHQRMDRDAA